MENQAVAAASEGERLEGSRLESLYRLHATKAKRTAYLLTGDVSAADDIVQDAFVRLAGRFVDLRRPDAIEAYLRRTIVNVAHSRHRRASRERANERRSADARPPASDPDMAAAIAVRDALSKLTERQRATVVLRFYEDLPESEIADALGCRPGTVKSLLSRAMKILREELPR